MVRRLPILKFGRKNLQKNHRIASSSMFLRAASTIEPKTALNDWIKKNKIRRTERIGTE